MDSIVFGPLIIPRYVMATAVDAFRCAECTRALRGGDRYGWIEDGAVCEPCADRLEAEHS